MKRPRRRLLLLMNRQLPRLLLRPLQRLQRQAVHLLWLLLRLPLMTRYLQIRQMLLLKLLRRRLSMLHLMWRLQQMLQLRPRQQQLQMRHSIQRLMRL
jgi:hypothetical protein